MKDVPEFGLDVRYTYDLRGLQTGAWFTGTGHGVYNAYDGFGRIVSTTSTMGGVSRTVSHLFDREGRRAELTFPDGFKFWFERDGLGRMAKARHGGWGTSGTVLATFAYNAKGLPESFTRGFGDKSVYDHDNVLRAKSLTDTFVGGTGNVVTGFTYNPASQLRTELRDNDAYAWRGSVPVARTYWANGQNQYLQTVSNGVVSATFTHDANGNLTGDGTTSFTYDSENRLLTASGAKTAALAYDPLGRLWQVTGALGTTQFLYDGDELVAEYNPQGALLKRYVHGDGTDDPLFWYEGFDLTHPRFPHTDRKGSIVAVAGSGGALLSINTYDEYGIPGGANQGRFQYTGQAWLAELGMYYYKARIYSPTLGRFLQTDPIGYEDQINLYAYVRNDPVNLLDPLGLETTCNRTKESIVCSTKVDPQQAPEGGSAVTASKMNKNNPPFQKSGVGNSALDQAASELGSALPEGNREGGFKMVISESDQGTTVESTRIARGGEGQMRVDPADLQGADAFFHTEPPIYNTGVPGLGDIDIPAQLGIANYAGYGEQVTAIEISSGRAQLRPVNHNNSRGFQDRANDYQARRRSERRQFR